MMSPVRHGNPVCDETSLPPGIRLLLIGDALRQYTMKTLGASLAVLMFIAFSLPAHADKANAAYKRGTHAESQGDYDKAFEAYEEAYRLKSKNAKYFATYTRIRFHAANEHIHSGQLLRDEGKLQEALVEFQRAAEIDRSSFIARQEVRRTTDLMRKQTRHEDITSSAQSPLSSMVDEADGPIEIPISNTKINLHMTETADKIYKVLGKLAGVNVLIDADYRPQRVSIELNDVTAREALNMLALQSKTFWQPASSNTIFISQDTPGKRKEIQGNVMKTFYLKNVSTPAELQEAANTVRGILDVNRVQLIPAQSAIVLRGTAAQMVFAEKLFSDIDKPKSEVVIDITVMQVSRTRTRTMGTSPPTSANVVLIPGTGGSGSGGGGQFTLNQLKNLTANNVGVTIPGASLSFLMGDSNTKILQNPEIRALDNEKATLKIGDRVPIATGSFAGTSTGSALVNTQFQYLDVGVNIDIVPHIHSPNEVTLKMVLEISSVTGSQNIGGITQPIIGQRRIEHETRLQDGDVNLVGGILEESETNSLSGYPWLTKIPILKYLFGQEEKDRRENEIVFAITPHIVRAQDLNERNLKLVDVGTGNAVELRRKDQKAAPATTISPAPQGSSTQPKDTVPSKLTLTRPMTVPQATMAAPVQGDRPQVLASNSNLLHQGRSKEQSPNAAVTGSPPAHEMGPCATGQHAVDYGMSGAVCAAD
jgi:general secretion pathway protein D